MKKINLFTKFILIITIIVFLLVSGCGDFVPNNDYVGEYEEENTKVSRLEIIPNKVEILTDQSQIFEVRAYNSENKLVPAEPSNIKWSVSFQCWQCGVVWKITPIKNSLQTTFIPSKKGRYKIYIEYDDTAVKWPEAVVTVK